MKKTALDEFCGIRSISRPTFSPNGNRLCFVVSQADRKKNNYRSYIYELRGSKAVQLTSFGSESAFVWLDDDTVLFPGNREESKEPSIATKYYRLSLTGGEAVEAFTLPIPVSALMPLENGDFIAVGTVFPGWEDLYKGDKKRAEEYLKFRRDNEDYEIVDQVPWWWNGSSFTKSAYSTVYYYSSRKKTLKPLTEPGFSAFGAKLNADKTEVWCFLREVKPLQSMEDGTELCRIRLGDFSAERVASNNDHFSMESVEFGEKFAIITASDRSYGLNTDPDFYKLSYEDNSVTLYAKFGEGVGSSVGSDVRHGGGYSMKMDGDALYFIATVFDAAHLYKLEGGKIAQVTDKAGSVDSFDVKGGKIALTALWDMRPQELYEVSGKRLTRLNDRVISGKYIAKPEKLNFETAGHEVHGFVLKPFAYEPGKKYPVIIDIHGGPKTVYGEVYYHEMQYWASLGYFVIYCNPTGSDGRNTFSDIRGKYGTVDYDDIMAFCDEALKAYPGMDADNFFETGGSYGGFMTNWIIGHTDRFRACASQRSISNWFSFWGVSDIGIEFGRDQCQSDPWNDPEKLWAHSPLKYADRVKTPTLFIHSFEDYRCPIDQGYQMYSALIKHGVESKMVLFKGENHELSRSGKPLHRIKRLDEITKWFISHKG